jgi:hypothetical protein
VIGLRQIPTANEENAMNLGTLSVSPTTYTYRNIHEMIRDYRRGRPVMVRGYGPLAGLTVDTYEERTFKELGYTAIEFRYGAQSKEVSL